MTGHGDDLVIGEVGLSNIDQDRRAALIGYWVAPAARGRGVATDAVEAVSRWALGPGRLAALVASVDPANERSVAVLVAAGFEHLGVVGPTEVQYVRRSEP